MNSWEYINETPVAEVTLIGDIFLKHIGLVDSGARISLVHPLLVQNLGLMKRGTAFIQGMGHKEPVIVDIYSLKIDLSGKRMRIDIATTDIDHYPERLPKVILGRNFLNHFKVTLDGERTYFEEKSNDACASVA